MDFRTERRQFPRRKCLQASATYRFLDPRWRSVYASQGRWEVCDISMAGFSLMSDQFIPCGTPVCVRLRLAGDFCSDDIGGQVVRLQACGDNLHAVAVRFDWWQQELDRTRLARFLGGYAASGPYAAESHS